MWAEKHYINAVPQTELHPVGEFDGAESGYKEFLSVGVGAQVATGSAFEEGEGALWSGGP